MKLQLVQTRQIEYVLLVPLAPLEHIRKQLAPSQRTESVPHAPLV